jgi:Fic family protein
MTNKQNSLNSPDTSANQLQILIKSIEKQHEIIDRNLTKPAKWYGRARRELEGREDPDVRKRIGIAFNNLIEKVQNKDPLNVELLLSIHRDLMEEGGQFRSKGVRVGKKDPIRRPHSSKVPSLVAQAIARADDGVEPPLLAAARLHLELLIIHPFSDSNGRAARLLASFVLMRAGYYSTLLSAVEQHFQVHPRAYARTFRVLREGKENDHAPWLITTLEAMLFNSTKASWFLSRKDELFEALLDTEIPEESWVQTVIDYDLFNKTKDSLTLTAALGKSFSPMIELAEDIPGDELRALVLQVERLYYEEMNENNKSDNYTLKILTALKERVIDKKKRKNGK